MYKEALVGRFMRRKGTAVALSLAMAVSVIGSAPGAVAAKKISVTKKVNLKAGKKGKITIKANGFKIKKVSAKSSDKKIVKVVKATKKSITVKGADGGKGSAKIKIKINAKNNKGKTKKYSFTTKVVCKSADNNSSSGTGAQSTANGNSESGKDGSSSPSTSVVPSTNVVASPDSASQTSAGSAEVSAVPVTSSEVPVSSSGAAASVAPESSVVPASGEPNQTEAPISVTKESFGMTKDGEAVTKYTLKNANNMSVSFLDFGAIIQAINVPDKNGKIDDVVLGFDDIASYENNPSYFGAFLGRHANRIAGGKFELNGVTYELEKNDSGRNNLHGGNPGYHKVMYKAEVGDGSVSFSRTSPDGEQGFPGNLDLKVTYTLTNDNELKIDYWGQSDADTLCNLSNHSYFNLKGHDSGSIVDHLVQINAEQITRNNRNSVPNGKYVDVANTPFDFRTLTPVSKGIGDSNTLITNAGGYDHNFVLNKGDGEFAKVGEVLEETSGRKMEIYTDLPGIQFYSGNYISQNTGKNGAAYSARCGMCFETQFFPDSINHAEFKQCILKKGEEYNSRTVYKFSN